MILFSEVSFMLPTFFGSENFLLDTNILLVDITIGEIELLATLYSCAKYLCDTYCLQYFNVISTLSLGVGPSFLPLFYEYCYILFLLL